MPQRGRKNWCKYCKKSFPSARSLRGHMTYYMGRLEHRKQPMSKLNLPSVRDSANRYSLREKRHSTWWLCDSSDDEYLPLVPKTECQLCFKVFASCDALSMHMRVHARHEKMMMANKEESREVATLSNGYGDHIVTVPTPVMLTYGIEEVGAARILMKLSGHSDMCTAAEEDCNEGYEIDGNSAYCVQQNQMEFDYTEAVEIGDAELETESSSSDGEMKFSSLSNVLKVTTIHECPGVLKAATMHKCKVCGKVFTSGQALGGHKKCHKARGHEKAATSPNSAVDQTGKQLLEANRGLVQLNLPALSDKDYGRRSRKSKPNPWWTASRHSGERMLDVV
ncbi:hypothetical protein ACP70R_045642 [Stipagrostis hirtigluma subsp. patula]